MRTASLFLVGLLAFAVVSAVHVKPAPAASVGVIDAAETAATSKYAPSAPAAPASYDGESIEKAAANAAPAAPASAEDNGAAEPESVSLRASASPSKAAVKSVADLSEMSLESIPRGHAAEMKHASCAKACLGDGGMDLMETTTHKHAEARDCVLKCLQTDMSETVDMAEEAPLPADMAQQAAKDNAAVAAAAATAPPPTPAEQTPSAAPKVVAEPKSTATGEKTQPPTAAEGTKQEASEAAKSTTNSAQKAGAGAQNAVDNAVTTGSNAAADANEFKTEAQQEMDAVKDKSASASGGVNAVAGAAKASAGGAAQQTMSEASQANTVTPTANEAAPTATGTAAAPAAGGGATPAPAAAVTNANSGATNAGAAAAATNANASGAAATNGAAASEAAPAGAAANNANAAAPAANGAAGAGANAANGVATDAGAAATAADASADAATHNDSDGASEEHANNAASASEEHANNAASSSEEHANNAASASEEHANNAASSSEEHANNAASASEEHANNAASASEEHAPIDAAPATDAPAADASNGNSTTNGNSTAASSSSDAHTEWLHELTCVSQCLFLKHNTQADIEPCMDECAAKKEGRCEDDQDCADGYYCADYDEDDTTPGMCGKKYLHFCNPDDIDSCPNNAHCLAITENEHGFCIDGEGNMVTQALSKEGKEEDPAMMALEEQVIKEVKREVNAKGKPDVGIRLHKVMDVKPLPKEVVDAMPDPPAFFEEGDDALHPLHLSAEQKREISFAEMGSSLRAASSWSDCGKVGAQWGASADCDNPTVRDEHNPDKGPYYEARIGFHFAVPSSGGDASLTETWAQKVAAQMTTMNQAYKHMKIYWTAKVYFWASDKLYNAQVEKTGASADDVCKQCARTVPESSRPAYCTGSSSPYCCLNPHLVPDESKCLAFDQVVADIQAAGAQANVDFTDHFQGYPVNFIQSTLAGFAYMQGNYPESGQIALSVNRINGKMMTLPHEAGHALELKHTFTGTDEQSSCSAKCYESADSSDRNIVGDLCSDTNPNIRHFQCSNPNSKDKCTSNVLGNTPYTNVMSYGVDSCRAIFTTQQSARARCWLKNGPRTKAMYTELTGTPDVSCALECANGGTLDSSTCTCSCPSGFSGLDCTLEGDGSATTTSSTSSTSSSSSSSSPASQTVPMMLATLLAVVLGMMMF